MRYSHLIICGAHFFASPRSRLSQPVIAFIVAQNSKTPCLLSLEVPSSTGPLSRGYSNKELAKHQFESPLPLLGFVIFLHPSVPCSLSFGSFLS